GIGDITRLMGEITVVAAKNAGDLEKIQESIGQINGVAERNHASAALTAAASEQMRGMAARLNEIMRSWGKRHTRLIEISKSKIVSNRPPRLPPPETDG
ncbi:MAG: hypothetical protein LBV15_02090, partial [Planctomycetota bacterium]|nr:hypothetical protein [Planctomycetota bacterium]